MQAKRQVKGNGAGGAVDAPAARVHPETVQRIERSMGALGTAAIAAMDERLPWFRKMSAENRSWLGLVAQAGIAAFADWIKHPERAVPLPPRSSALPRVSWPARSACSTRWRWSG